jgi:hypothetical protein
MAFSPLHAKEDDKNNLAHQQHAQTPTVQTQMEIGESDDAYEKEADAMADKVMQSPKADLQMMGNEDEGEESIQMMGNEEEDESIQMMGNEEEEEKGSPIQPKLQLASTQGGDSGDEEEDETRLQKKPAIQRSGEGVSHASPALTNQINSTKGNGQSLPNNTQKELGNKMGADFSNVNIHTDDNAVQMNTELGAKAFTHGNDVYFNEGNYNPTSSEGKHLLAHELTHTIQQSGGGMQVQLEPDPDEEPLTYFTYTVLSYGKGGQPETLDMIIKFYGIKEEQYEFILNMDGSEFDVTQPLTVGQQIKLPYFRKQTTTVLDEEWYSDMSADKVAKDQAAYDEKVKNAPDTPDQTTDGTVDEALMEKRRMQLKQQILYGKIPKKDPPKQLGAPYKPGTTADDLKPKEPVVEEEKKPIAGEIKKPEKDESSKYGDVVIKDKTYGTTFNEKEKKAGEKKKATLDEKALTIKSFDDFRDFLLKYSLPPTPKEKMLDKEESLEASDLKKLKYIVGVLEHHDINIAEAVKSNTLDKAMELMKGLWESSDDAKLFITLFGSQIVTSTLYFGLQEPEPGLGFNILFQGIYSGLGAGGKELTKKVLKDKSKSTDQVGVGGEVGVSQAEGKKMHPASFEAKGSVTVTDKHSLSTEEEGDRKKLNDAKLIDKSIWYSFEKKELYDTMTIRKMIRDGELSPNGDVRDVTAEAKTPKKEGKPAKPLKKKISEVPLLTDGLHYGEQNVVKASGSAMVGQNAGLEGDPRTEKYTAGASYKYKTKDKKHAIESSGKIAREKNVGKASEFQGQGIPAHPSTYNPLIVQEGDQFVIPHPTLEGETFEFSSLEEAQTGITDIKQEMQDLHDKANEKEPDKKIPNVYLNSLEFKLKYIYDINEKHKLTVGGGVKVKEAIVANEIKTKTEYSGSVMWQFKDLKDGQLTLETGIKAGDDVGMNFGLTYLKNNMYIRTTLNLEDIKDININDNAQFKIGFGWYINRKTR